MARNRWITPQSEPPGTFFARRLLIPQGVDWLAIVNGALLELTYPNNFEQVDGISPDDAAQAFYQMFASYVTEDWSMIGVILPYATATAPPNTLACDGTSYLRTDYPALYAALDSAFVDDADHFHTPDLRGRAGIGSGTGSGLSARSVGDSGGTERVTLAVGEIPDHSHAYVPATGSVVTIGTGAPAPSAVPGIGSTGGAGGGSSHDNMMPFAVVGYCIIAR